MDINDIMERYRLGDYRSKMTVPKKVRPDHIFDEELSVRRNREMVEEHNERVDLLRKESYNIQAELDKKLSHDICCYITETYHNISYEVAVKIKRFCYTHWHSEMYVFFNYIDIVSSFVDDILSEEETE